MKIIQINTTCGVGSTGKICVGISEMMTEYNIENYIFYSNKSNGYELGISCSNERYIKIQSLKARIFGNYGFNSKKATLKMISELDRIKPDIVHLHNIHGHDCNLETLFNYFKTNKTKLIWTFHDCWVFTGYCTFFDMINCEKWKAGCENCGKKQEYSWIFDKSASLFERKRNLFEGLDLTIVTPSQWLGDLVKQSFLKIYPVKVINNGIDLDIFKPMQSNFRAKYGLAEKKILLGVAFDWGSRKGLDVFIKLAYRLSNEEYQIVLVGTNSEIEKKLPKNIISIHRTQNNQELAEIYTAADLFVNPTREDNYPTVNMEAIACGTPVLTFNTGGSPEMIDEKTGVIVESEDIDILKKEIVNICEKKPYSRAACINKSKEFDKKARFKEYVQLYERVINTRNQAN